MDRFELKEINTQMGEMEYQMFQDIPAKENGSTNLCYGIPYENFGAFIESQMSRKYQNISKYDTPTIIYLMYVNKFPVDYIGIRTMLDKNWKNGLEIFFMPYRFQKDINIMEQKCWILEFINAENLG